MKKFLLTLAVGIAMLSLPLTASAVGLTDYYTGNTASITVGGFRLYSTSAGANAGMKQFSWTARADTKLTGPQNTQGYFVNNGIYSDYDLTVWLNANTFMEINHGNAIAAKGGPVIIDGYLKILHTKGATLNSSGNLNLPSSAGLAASEDVIYGSAVMLAQVDAKTHNMILKLENAAIYYADTEKFTSTGSSGSYIWSQTGDNHNWMAAATGYPRMTTPAISVSPMKLTVDSYVGPWWQ